MTPVRVNSHSPLLLLTLNYHQNLIPNSCILSYILIRHLQKLKIKSILMDKLSIISPCYHCVCSLFPLFWRYLFVIYSYNKNILNSIKSKNSTFFPIFYHVCISLLYQIRLIGHKKILQSP